jgi:hypothetical protein
MILVTVFVLVVAVGLYINYEKQKKLKQAQAAYAHALAELSANPGDNNFRIAALTAGRHYADMARQMAGRGGRAMFDEVALSNDITARTGTATVSSAENKKCPQCAELVKVDARICRFCQHKFGQAA